jgi:hypothetical protein
MRIEAAPCRKRTTEQPFALSFGILTEHLTKTQIANKTGTNHSDYHFEKLFKKYTKEGGCWRCTAATATTRRKQYELV